MYSMRMISACAALTLTLIVTVGGAPTALADEDAGAAKPRITKADDLPRHTYKIDEPAATLIQSAEAVEDLMAALEKDTVADLKNYDIQDKTTLKDLFGRLVMIAEMRGDYAMAQDYAAKMRDLEDKDADKLMTGVALGCRARARDAAGDDDDAFRAAFAQDFAAELAKLPYDVVADKVQQSKGQFEMSSEPLLMGLVQERLQPAIDNANGEVSTPMAAQIVGMHFMLNHMLPLKEDFVAVLNDYIDAHHETKEDIWEARSVDLTGKADLNPVVVAIWDTGVDAQVFGDQMFTNPDETADGQDNDQNGYVDDVHGIAYDVHWRKTDSILFPMDEATTSIPTLQSRLKGMFDMQAAQDSEEATAFKQYMASLAQDDVKNFILDMTRYTLYSHGTHVAGIAVEGNPAASILAARLTGEVSLVPEIPTMEDSKRAAQAYGDVIDYFKAAGVRVVNMSWVVPRSSFESALEQNGVGDSPEERKQMAREMFDVGRDAMREAMAGAPSILFVGGAGNSNNDIAFDEFYPPMFELDNLLIAGAVDQAGEPTDFTSFGPTVNIYSNGFEVDSYVPGGDRLALSGTSMASPNVANLAAKLFAVDPSLTPAQVKDLIVATADLHQEGEQKLRIMNPAGALEALQANAAQAASGD